MRLRAPKSTNSEALAAIGLTREELEALDDDCNIRSATLAWFPTPDGDPVVGITYRCDYRAEEEYGIGKLMKKICGDEPRSFHQTKGAEAYIGFFSDVNGLILTTEPLEKDEFAWGEPVGQPSWMQGDSSSYTDYARHFSDSLPYAQGVNDVVNRWMSVAQIRAVGKELGLQKMPRKKDDLLAVVAAAAATQQVAKHPNVWPGWFHNGKQLILRADSGPTARVLARVAKAAREGYLGIGSGSSNPFVRGLIFFDARDETEGLRQEVKRVHDWHDARMKEAEPAIAELERLGYRWYFFGNPREIDTGDGEKKVRYWLNGLRLADYYDRREIRADEEEKEAVRRAGHIAGWFTSAELLDRDQRVLRLEKEAAEHEETKRRYSKVA